MKQISLKLPCLISDGMILQRNTEVKIWGWAAAGERVEVLFKGSKYSTVVDRDNSWTLALPPQPAGGPFQMRVTACGRTISIKDILIGDVWVCSGQSNMEIPLSRVKELYEAELNSVNNSEIRQFSVPMRYDFNKAQSDLEGGEWKSVAPESILDFSAVAYFFALTLYERYRVPVALIKASEGGTPVEAWMSREALQPFPRKLKEIERYKDREYLEKIIRKNEENEKDWYRELYKKDRGLARNKLPWYAPEYDCSDWDTMEIPVFFEDQGLKDFNGVIWLRREIELPVSMASKEARLIMGRIIDSDTAYINGIRVGETAYQYPPRKYDIPEGVLRKGKNQLVIRVVCNNGQGGIAVDKPYKITAGEQSLDLKGEWKYRVGAVCRPLPEIIFVQRKASGLFNGMIAPLLKYRIRGVIWYQGESNDSNPLEYEELFTSMINDWREKWGQETIPFLYVQLPNHGVPAAYSPDSCWAVIREAQRLALSVPETAMAVTIDLGEWNDLHPLNKKDVGIRLALAARHLVYGDKDLVYSGPLYRSIKVEGDKAVLSFDNVGAGLISRGSKKPAGFFIAGTDKGFLAAEAEIRDKRVIVWNDRVEKPLAVAYAWADNPAAASLYNKEGLPASPFRTDNYRNPIDKSE